MAGKNKLNPIIKCDYPDVDVIRVDDTYYMISTTMYFMPGAEILRSYDLMHWEHAAYVYDRLDSTPGQCLEEKRMYTAAECGLQVSDIIRVHFMYALSAMIRVRPISIVRMILKVPGKNPISKASSMTAHCFLTMTEKYISLTATEMYTWRN